MVSKLWSKVKVFVHASLLDAYPRATALAPQTSLSQLSKNRNSQFLVLKLTYLSGIHQIMLKPYLTEYYKEFQMDEWTVKMRNIKERLPHVPTASGLIKQTLKYYILTILLKQLDNRILCCLYKGVSN